MTAYINQSNFTSQELQKAVADLSSRKVDILNDPLEADLIVSKFTDGSISALDISGTRRYSGWDNFFYRYFIAPF